MTFLKVMFIDNKPQHKHKGLNLTVKVPAALKKFSFTWTNSSKHITAGLGPDWLPSVRNSNNPSS